MMRIAKGVFDALKPGGVFVYNIFDYFDNDRTIVFSDMGKRRISLASPTVALFKSLGFEFVACAIWDKGDNQGNRGFNGGNRTPFYQSPFNCWEHVLVFRKPGKSHIPALWSKVLHIQPVIKIVKGENTFGHTAPYPEALVEPFLANLSENDVVLDPFAGSSTTALAAIRRGLKPWMIEMHEEYVELSRRRIRQLRDELKNRIF
jgi:DNA modification methylase